MNSDLTFIPNYFFPSSLQCVNQLILVVIRHQICLQVCVGLGRFHCIHMYYTCTCLCNKYFFTGLYGIENNPSFVYATYNKKIYIYNNIQLPQVESTNLIEVMEKRENTHELLEKIGVQGILSPHTVYTYCLFNSSLWFQSTGEDRSSG